MPGLPQAPQGAGGAGLIALEEDGGAAGACVRWPFRDLWERAWARPLRVGSDEARTFEVATDWGTFEPTHTLSSPPGVCPAVFFSNFFIWTDLGCFRHVWTKKGRPRVVP